ncbi:hypothetical protein NE237_007880 [Protea cynaroides]|uniref:Ubiquitin-like modifier-activating enzyme Atg7 N-terminal domain-containing protein n=1 Tax=Protea cynaroides TaxID=273540 RepID=A0A9Q0KR27_9MAGN|nr:hypothetical protein NE237_007880 [Protea cynaroides]
MLRIGSRKILFFHDANICFYAPCSHAQVSNHFTLLAEALPPKRSEQASSVVLSHGNRNRCPVPGILYNTNTLESFHVLDKQSLLKAEAKKILFGFYDPCLLPNNPGWPLRNFISLISARWNLKWVRFLCYREKQWFADLGSSLVGGALVSVPQGWNDSQCVPNVVGWELIKGRKVSRRIGLAASTDPTRLAISAADLNLKLMRCALCRLLT